MTVAAVKQYRPPTGEMLQNGHRGQYGWIKWIKCSANNKSAYGKRFITATPMKQ